MTAYLLDVNVIIALIDADHVHHEAANEWFARRGHSPWATCPLTENGVLRIVGNPSYPGSPGTPAAVVPILAELRELPGHVWWRDDVSILDRSIVYPSRLLSAGQITDSYLLALARAHGGKLATFDRRMVTSAVHGGTACVHRIGID